MEIKILDRDSARKESYSINKKCIIISINDVCESRNKFCKNNKNIKDILYLAFGDVEEKHEDSYVLPMDVEDAKKIKHFIELWKDKVELIIVHCAAGISRSAAIGHFLNIYINNIEPEELFKNPNYSPNMNCFKLMYEVYGMYIDEIGVEHLRNINNEYTMRYFANSNDLAIQKLNKMFIKNDNGTVDVNLNF